MPGGEVPKRFKGKAASATVKLISTRPPRKLYGTFTPPSTSTLRFGRWAPAAAATCSSVTAPWNRLNPAPQAAADLQLRRLPTWREFSGADIPQQHGVGGGPYGSLAYARPTRGPTEPRRSHPRFLPLTRVAQKSFYARPAAAGGLAAAQPWRAMLVAARSAGGRNRVLLNSAATIHGGSFVASSLQHSLQFTG